ncbi:helix-turn-helix domain-containing protein [Alloyangia pacifica]|uniref:helix-turn-helix domain-containing protein n=1 Tax=Alloyangia pacifica TaxID=311180 RepID=UPI001CFCE4BC|nr:helix-turn-helix domain-containing protein [Alloyangia pacifica]
MGEDATNNAMENRPSGRVATVFAERVVDYRGMAEPLLPVAEASVTHLKPGPGPSHLAIFSSDKVSVLGVNHHTASVGVVIVKPECFAFMWWDGSEEYRINGTAAEQSVLYAQGKQDGFHAAGGARRTGGIVVRRDHLVAALAALRGVGPEDVHLDPSALKLTDAVATGYRRDFSVLMRAAAGAGPPLASGARESDLSDAFFGLLLDAYLFATPDKTRQARREAPERIVRKAEERFFEAEAGPISLADICAAAGVSQSSLYRAFHSVCGEAPLAYFQKRRLTDARRYLVAAEAARGAVRNAALSVGFTEMGRFSVEYRRLFGESPSATLKDGSP